MNMQKSEYQKKLHSNFKLFQSEYSFTNIKV